MNNKTKKPSIRKRVKGKALGLALGFAVLSGVGVSAAQSDYGDLISDYTTLGTREVVTSKTSDLNNKTNNEIESIMAKNIKADFIVNKLAWGSSTRVVTAGSTVGNEDTNDVFKGQGFSNSQWAKSGVKTGDMITIENVGYGMDTTTGTKNIPLDIKVVPVVTEATTCSVGNPSYKVAFRGNSGALFMHVILMGDVGSGNTGGDTPGGSGGGGTNVEAGCLDYVDPAVQIINHNTGQPIPENSIIGMRYGDIDQGQKLSVMSDGIVGYILGPNTKLTPTVAGYDGFEGSDSRVVADNPSILTGYSVLQMLHNNVSVFMYNPTDDRTSNIAVSIFGDFEVNLGWQIDIDKSIDVANNKTTINGLYNPDNLYFDIIKDNNKNGKLDSGETTKLGTIDIDSKWQGQSEMLMEQDVLLVEHSNNLPGTNMDMVDPIGVHGEYGDTKTVKPLNKSLLGENTLNKQDVETGTTHQGNGSFIGAQYALFHANGTPVKWTEENPNGLPQFEILKGKKANTMILGGNEKIADYTDAIVLEITEDDANALVGIKNLPAGDYYWQELNSSTGYVLDANKVPFSIKQSLEDQTYINTENTVSKEQGLKFNVRLHKFIVTNDTNIGVNDVEFTAKGINGNNSPAVSGMTTIDQATNEDGFATLQLAYGDWRIDETLRAPGMDRIATLYVRMFHDLKTDQIITEFHMKEDFSDAPIFKRQWNMSDNTAEANPNLIGTIAGNMTSDNFTMSSSTIEAKDEPDLVPNVPEKDVQLTDTSESINHGEVKLDSPFVYVLKAKRLDGALDRNIKSLTIYDNFDEKYDHYKGTYRVYFALPFADYNIGDVMPADFWSETYDAKTETVTLTATQKLLNLINANNKMDFDFEVHTDMLRTASADKIINPSFTQTTNGQDVKSNPVDTHTPKVQPHKYSLSELGFDMNGNKLLNDDRESKDPYSSTNKNPYSDKTNNNEKQNINTKLVKRGQTYYYQVWLDTTKFSNNSELLGVRVADDYDQTMLNVNIKNAKVYDGVTGKVNSYFKIYDKDGIVYAEANKFKEVPGYNEGKVAKIVDTKYIPFGRYYKLEIPVTVKANANINKDIVNTAWQDTVGNEGCGDYNPGEPSNPNNPFDTKCNDKQITEKRVNPLKEKLPDVPLTGGILPILLVGGLATIGTTAFVARRKMNVDVC